MFDKFAFGNKKITKLWNQPTKFFLREISEKRLIIRLLKRKSFPWSMMHQSGYAFDKGLGKNETGPLINQMITENRYNSLNLYAFQKRVSFKLDETSSGSKYHKKSENSGVLLELLSD